VRSANRLFLGRDGFPLSANAGADIIKRLGQAAGVENCIPHRLRHTFATWYLTSHPGDELGLRRIIGHASNEVTADYVHLAQSTVAQRAGQSSLAETLGATPMAQAPIRPVDRRKEPILTAWGSKVAADAPDPESRPPAAAPRRAASIDRDGLIDAVRNDPSCVRRFSKRCSERRSHACRTGAAPATSCRRGAAGRAL
jgi:hypothetical protein